LEREDSQGQRLQAPEPEVADMSVEGLWCDEDRSCRLSRILRPPWRTQHQRPAGGSLGGLRTATAGAACRRLVPVSKANGSTPHAGEDKAPRNARSGAIRWLENGMRAYRNHHDGAAMAHDAPL
jgi:hypothetical protein